MLLLQRYRSSSLLPLTSIDRRSANADDTGDDEEEEDDDRQLRRQSPYTTASGDGAANAVDAIVAAIYYDHL